MSEKQPLTLRIRPNSEAAPWVIEEIKILEAGKAFDKAKIQDLELRLANCRATCLQHEVNELKAVKTMQQLQSEIRKYFRTATVGPAMQEARSGPNPFLGADETKRDGFQP